MSESEDFNDCYSLNSFSSESDECDECDDNYYEEYVLKHLHSAFIKFKNIPNIFLKHLIIIWYLIDIVSIRPSYLTDVFTYSDFFIRVIEEYDNINHKNERCCFDYKLHCIKSNLIKTLEIEKQLSNHLKKPLDSCFLPRLKEIIYYYINHKNICKRSIDSLFKCLLHCIKLD